MKTTFFNPRSKSPRQNSHKMPPPHRYLHNNFTYVSSCTKYLIFLLNFIFWLFGGLLIGVGLYSFLDKFKATGLIKVDTYYDVLLNVSIILLLAGVIVFIVSFCGCLGELISSLNHCAKLLQRNECCVAGALRENTCLLKFYTLCLLIFFFLEMGIVMVAFIFPHTMNSLLEDSFTERVSRPSLQFFSFFFAKY